MPRLAVVRVGLDLLVLGLGLGLGAFEVRVGVRIGLRQTGITDESEHIGKGFEEVVGEGKGV